MEEGEEQIEEQETVNIELSPEEYEEFCCVYAALILNDDKKELNITDMNLLIEASGNRVNPKYIRHFVKAAQKVDINSLIAQMGISEQPLMPLLDVEEKTTPKPTVTEEPGPEMNSDIFGNENLDLGGTLFGEDF